MQNTEQNQNTNFKPIKDDALLAALNALGRAINIISTYGNHHPAFQQSISAALISMHTLFLDRKKINLGAFNGVITIDNIPVESSGTLMKSLERRLIRLRITGLRIARGISEAELTQLAELLASTEASDFSEGINRASLSHITTETSRYEVVEEDQTVANKNDLAAMSGGGVLVLEDETGSGGTGGGDSDGAAVHVDQIVAFLKGDIDLDEADIGEELSELASNPDRLGQMIMESVSIRQAASELSGESLNDVVLGCLRRTYDGLRKQPAFQSSEGIADLKKALLLLEESMLDKLRSLTGESDPELDREIVQAIREMDENLEFELAANQYVEHRQAIQENEKQLQSYLAANGTDAAEELISNTDFPNTDWRRIVVESQQPSGAGPALPIVAGLNTLTTVFEKLETLMKSDGSDNSQLKNLLGQATDNIDVTADATKEKLELLSKQLDDTGTIGGHGLKMNRRELLSSISEISQELMQPLTAINASLEMMLGGYVGEINPEQRPMLELASNSGTHLTYLMKELIAIVGCPVNKGVDDRFHTTSEQVVLLEKKAG
jgi:hypothetical protein